MQRLCGEAVKGSLVTEHQLVSPSTLPSTSLGVIKTSSKYTAAVTWGYNTLRPVTSVNERLHFPIAIDL